MHKIKKQYKDYPFAHRQWAHDGHCALVHGHSWGFDFTIMSKERDKNGFVFDFGKLKPLKALLDATFDHTLLISPDDPCLKYFQDMADLHLCHLRVMDGSAENIAEWLFHKSNEIVDKESKGNARVIEVTVWEDSKNSATFFRAY